MGPWRIVGRRQIAMQPHLECRVYLEEGRGKGRERDRDRKEEKEWELERQRPTSLFREMAGKKESGNR